LQEAFLRTIPGLEQLKIVRPAYAIEYDCIDPLGLGLNLETKAIPGLFCAGQLNGSSGYEEAAAQGLMAGINAALSLRGEPPFILDRSEAYIGVLLDDMITKGTNEPYRILTSRAEYRLLLRQDNADLRLTPKAAALGLASHERVRRLEEKIRQMAEESERLRTTWLNPSEANPGLLEAGLAPMSNKATLEDLLRRPEITYEFLAPLDPGRPDLPEHVTVQLEIQVKYQGYIDKQLAQIERFKRMEGRNLPQDLDYHQLEGLRLEARQKLHAQRPLSLGQASRISGVSPADINVLLIHLEKRKRKGEDQ
jgi:tRNA uridine 5-carboxymethylaminomethyl modification enzyme